MIWGLLGFRNNLFIFKDDAISPLFRITKGHWGLINPVIGNVNVLMLQIESISSVICSCRLVILFKTNLPNSACSP
jgi:hypothetical protein